MTGIEKSSIRFVPSVAVLSGGAALAQGIVILTAPIIARLFAPETFGLAALFSSLAMIIGIAACLGYDQAIMLPQEDEKAANLLGFCLILATGTALMTALVTAAFGKEVLELLRATEVQPYLWLLPISVFVFGIRYPFYQWFSRQKRFKHIAGVDASVPIFRAACCIGGGVLGLVSAGNLISFQIVATAAGPIILLFSLARNDGRFIMNVLRFATMRRLAGRFVKFPLFSLWANLLNMASVQVPIILMVVFFGKTIGGCYYYAMVLLTMPSMFFGQAVAQVFFRHAADRRGSDLDLGILVEAVYARLLRLGIFPFALLMIIGPGLFQLYLGSQWTQAGVFAGIMAPMLLLQFAAVPLTTLFSVLERQGAKLIFNLVLFLCQILALYVGHRMGNVHLTVGLFAATGVLAYGFLSLWLPQKAGVSPARIAVHLLKALLGVLPFAGVVALAKWRLPLGLFSGAVIVGLCTLIYYAIFLKTDQELRKEILGLINPHQKVNRD